MPADTEARTHHLPHRSCQLLYRLLRQGHMFYQPEVGVPSFTFYLDSLEYRGLTRATIVGDNLLRTVDGWR
jgi:hypothetical protein